MDVIIYLRYDNVLEYAINKDAEGAFREMKEGSWVAFNPGDTLIWKVSANPGRLERIKIKKTNKKDGVRLPKGSWKSQWITAPCRINDCEYTGQPDAEGCSHDHPYAFAYDIDYQLSGGRGWVTLDPSGWSPPPPPDE